MKKNYLISLIIVTAIAFFVVWQLTSVWLTQKDEASEKSLGIIGQCIVISNGVGTMFRDFQFLNENQGWGVTNNSLWKTEDGGLTWIEIRKASTVELPYFGSHEDIMEKVQFLSRSEGWIIEGRHLMHTTDGGASWQKHEFEHVIVRSFHFLDSDNGWFAGQLLRLPSTKEDVETWHPVVYGTKDGGKTWSSLFTGPEDRYPLWDVWAISSKEIWAVGAFILHSDDGGKTWEKVSVKNRQGMSGIPVKIQFLNSNIGWIITNEENGYLFTNNGGKSWESRQALAGAVYIGRVVHITSMEAWAVAGNLYQSTDSGKSWVKVEEGDYSRIQYLKNENILFAAGKRIARCKLP